jgi:soluble lytic murein transglycosylase-like protein
MSLDYVAYLSNRPFIDGDVDKILAAYNGGEGRLYGILKDPKKRDQWLSYFPKETRDYVPRIKKQAGIK